MCVSHISDATKNEKIKTYGQDKAAGGGLHQLYVVIATIHHGASL